VSQEASWFYFCHLTSFICNWGFHFCNLTSTISRFATKSALLNLSSIGMDIHNVVIMGSGCAGHTAALYTARANLKPLILEGHEPGGQLSLTTLVENFPGFPEGIQGPELIENMRKQAARFGADYRLGHVSKADLSKQPIELSIGKETISTRTLIIASGASARWLGLPNEQALIGHGVSSCATCDGFFFSGKEISVIGGGDSAMEEATFLTRFATKVTLIHRREQFRASKIMLDRARANPKIAFLTDTVVDDVLDPARKEVTALQLRNVQSGRKWDFPTSAMFLGIGHVPNTKVFEGQLDMDADGYLITQKNVFTKVPGVFACGDVQDRRYRQAITAAGSGCMAALEVEKYLEDQGH
jgi:thioredoxin reductase (NADPH)